MNYQYLSDPAGLNGTERRGGASATRFTQLGFTLVELLIAMVVGLFMILVIASVFLGSKQTYRIQDNNSRIQENGRYVMENLGRTLRIAGYRDDPSSNPRVIFPAVTGFAAAEQFLNGVEGGSATVPDEVSFRFTGSGTTANNTIMDCGGQSFSGATLLTNRFYLSTTSPKTLRCDSTSTVGAATTTATYDLMDRVDDLQILYGEDTDGDKTPNRYVAASTISNWNNVYVVRVCALISSSEDNISPQAQTYTDCSGASKTATDRRLYRTFGTTINLRNKAV